MEKTIKCAECNKEFTYDEKPGYPRKYCPECSAKKKAEFEASKLPAASKVEAMMSQNPSRDASIVAQCLTKIVYTAPDITAESVLETYNYFLSKL